MTRTGEARYRLTKEGCAVARSSRVATRAYTPVPTGGREFYVLQPLLTGLIGQPKRGGTAGVLALAPGTILRRERELFSALDADPEGCNVTNTTTETLLIPGPTPVPPAVTEAMTAAMINHRSAQFTELATEVHEGLQAVFKTKQETIVLPAAGTGGMEAVIVNLLRPGDKVLAVTIGNFGDRFAAIAEAYGADVERLAFPWGQAVDCDQLEARLQADNQGKIKLVLVTHNETSTGVTNPLADIAPIVRRHGALLAVDAVSSLAAIDFRFDEWQIDVAVSGSQKALMCPPGLAVLAIGERAWQAADQATMPRHYFDWRGYRKSFHNRHTPYTPAVSLMYGLRAALRIIAAEGLDRVFARHRHVAQLCQDGVRQLGLELFADPGHLSETVTAIRAPEGVSPAVIRQRMRDKGFVLAGGQGPLSDTVFRIGHLGYIREDDVRAGLAALADVLAELQGEVAVRG